MARTVHAGPSWMAPMEVVRACANALGVATLTRLELQQALFRPHAVVSLMEDGFSAVCTFEEPRYPGLPQEVAVRLIAPAKENAS